MTATLELLPSRRLALLLAAAHVAAGAALCATAAGQGLLVGLWLALAASWRAAHRRTASLSAPGAVVAVEVTRELRVEVRERRGRTLRGRVLRGACVTPALVVVRFLPDGARRARAIVLASDSAGVEALRRLRVLLRWSTI